MLPWHFTWDVEGNHRISKEETQCPCRDLNYGPPKYRSEALLLVPASSVVPAMYFCTSTTKCTYLRYTAHIEERLMYWITHKMNDQGCQPPRFWPKPSKTELISSLLSDMVRIGKCHRTGSSHNCNLNVPYFICLYCRGN